MSCIRYWMVLIIVVSWYGDHRELHVRTHSFPALRSPELFILTGAERGQYLGAEGRVEAWLAERRELRQQFCSDMEFQQADGRWFQFSNQPTRQGGIVVTRTDKFGRASCRERVCQYV